MIDLIATGGMRHTVLVNGSVWSDHSQPHKAHESAYDVGVAALRQLAEGTVEAFPEIRVVSTNTVRAEPDPNQDVVEIPPSPDAPPTSDGGLELLDFLEAVDPFDPNDVVLLTPSPLSPIDQVIAMAMNAAAEESKTRSFPRNMLIVPVRIEDPAGGPTPVRVGAVWRGYKLGFDKRDKTAIRIGMGGGS